MMLFGDDNQGDKPEEGRSPHLRYISDEGTLCGFYPVSTFTNEDPAKEITRSVREKHSRHNARKDGNISLFEGYSLDRKHRLLPFRASRAMLTGVNKSARKISDRLFHDDNEPDTESHIISTSLFLNNFTYRIQQPATTIRIFITVSANFIIYAL